MDYNIPAFEFGGREIRCVVGELPATVEMDLENVLVGGSAQGFSATGTAKLLVVRRSVKALYVDGKQHPLIKRDARGAEEVDIPNLRDRESRKSLLDKLIHLVVEYNDWLGFIEPFSDVFASYLPEEGEGRTVNVYSEETERPNPTGSAPTERVEESSTAPSTSRPGGDRLLQTPRPSEPASIS